MCPLLQYKDELQEHTTREQTFQATLQVVGEHIVESSERALKRTLPCDKLSKLITITSKKTVGCHNCLRNKTTAPKERVCIRIPAEDVHAPDAIAEERL
jgi:hypothetical protein